MLKTQGKSQELTRELEAYRVKTQAVDTPRRGKSPRGIGSYRIFPEPCGGGIAGPRNFSGFGSNLLLLFLAVTPFTF